MALPIPKTPIYETKIISSKKTIKYRPFLVKEEKALLIAEQSEDVATMVETLKKVVDDCTFGALDVESLAVFDLEYLLAKIRSKSVGEIAELNIPCDNCGVKTQVNVDISNPEIVTNPEHTNKIALFDDVGVVLKYPKIDILNKLISGNNEVDVSFDAVIACIDFIYDAENIHHAIDQSKEELNVFLDALTKEQFDKIQFFFESMPKLEFNIAFTCPHCNTDVKRKVEGIHNFF